MQKTFIPAMAGVFGAGHRLGPGQIAVANAEAFNSLHFSEPLTSYALDWDRQLSELRDELEFLSPAVRTPWRFEYAMADNATAFIGETDNSDIREIGAEYKTVRERGTTVQARVYDKGLTIRLDIEDIEGTASPNDAKRRAVDALKARLLRAEVFRASSLLLAAATVVNKQWGTGTSADSDPDLDLINALLENRMKSGVQPNRVVFGGAAWAKRIGALRGAPNAGNFQTAGFTPDQLAGFLNVDAVLLSKALRTLTDTTKEGLVPANKVYLYNALSGAGRSDPSNIKRFVSTRNGGEWTVYEQQVSAVLWDITVAHYSNIAVTSNLGIGVLDIA